MKNLKVGDEVWLFDTNRRVYRDNKSFTSSPIYSEYFYKVKISGETKRSWIINRDKYNKKTLDGLYTEELKEEKIWMNDNMMKIKDRISSCTFDQLKKIKKVIEED